MTWTKVWAPLRPHEGFYALASRLRPEYESLDDEGLRRKERERCYAAAR